MEHAQLRACVGGENRSTLLRRENFFILDVHNYRFFVVIATV